MEVFQRGEETMMSRGKQRTRFEEVTGQATTGETQSPDFSGKWQPAAVTSWRRDLKLVSGPLFHTPRTRNPAWLNYISLLGIK